MATPDQVLSTDDLLALVQSGNELAAVVDLDKLLHSILHRAGLLTDSSDGCVLLAREGGRGLYFAAATGTDAAMLLRTRGEFAGNDVPIEGSKAGEVFQSGHARNYSDLQADPRHFKGVDEQTRRQTESMVCAPLTALGERLGVMQVLNKRAGPYTERDRVLLQQFATQAAIAIRNARFFQDLLAHMGFYASPEQRPAIADLAQQLRGPMRSERLTLLFADMRGFTQLCQRVHSPDKIQEMLDAFLGQLAKQVLDHGGVVNKFLGDGVLAFVRDRDHACRAVRCAFAMLDAFQPLRDRWDETIAAQLDFLDVGVGIVTDAVMLGTIGSERVRDFTAIGTPVVLAAAFEKAARDGKHILVDQPTYSAVKDLVDAESMPAYVLRKSEQELGVPYKQYHLQRLRPVLRTKVFISHSHKDRQFVEDELIRPLPGYGIDTWYSRDDIRGGEAWVDSIHNGLKECAYVIVVVSQHSAAGNWVREEVTIAAAQQRFHGKIISVVLDETPVAAVHPHLHHLQALDAREAPPIAQRLGKVLGIQKPVP
jgi:class 3 adenylate cyclase